MAMYCGADPARIRWVGALRTGSRSGFGHFRDAQTANAACFAAIRLQRSTRLRAPAQHLLGCHGFDRNDSANARSSVVFHSPF